MNIFKRSGRPKGNGIFHCRPRRFELLEDRRVMAVVTGQSTFDASLFGDNIELMSDGNAVGYGYAINFDGQTLAAVGGDGQARTGADAPQRDFNSLTEMEISSVSKTVTATAILHILQSQPGGLDAALNTLLADYLPSDWTPGANVQNVTLRHLLTHSSGFLEEGNTIGVNFESYSQNTFTNLRSLVQAPLPAPTFEADDVYATPRWGSSYNNANFSLLAKVVLPKLLNPGINLTAANYANRDATSGGIYKEYVQDEIFAPLGIVADLAPTDVNPAKGYNLATAEVSPGLSQSNLTNTGGAFGWKMSARELATFLDGIRRDNSILTAATRQMRDDQQLGWYQSADAFGEFFTHNGATSGGAGNFRSQIVAMPADVEVSYLMNSELGNLPGGSIGAMLKTAYVNAWSDLTVAGTSSDDNFLIRLDNSGFRPSIEVVLNGVTEFTHWIDTFDSLTLNGGFGNDTFAIQGWNPSIDLNINGSFGNDAVSIMPGVRNIEWVNGMTFDGGFGDDSLVINDQNNPYSNASLSRIYTATSGSVARFAAHPAFPGNPAFSIPVVVGFSGVENLDLTTGGQQDVVSVVSKTSGQTQVRTGNGDDTIIVAQTAGNLETVDGLEVDGQAGLDTIRLFDHNKTSTDPDAVGQYDVESDSVSRYVSSLGSVSNGGSDGVGVEFSQVENLELTTTNMVDVIRVHATTTGLTTIHGGAGGDILNASSDGKNLETVDDLAFHGDAGLDSIVLNDQNNPYTYPGLNRQYEVSSAGVTRMTGLPLGQILLPVSIDVTYSSAEELTLKTGGQSDTVNVESVPSAGALLQTGAGDDVVNTSPTGANFESIHGLQVDGGAGNDALNIHDENNPYDLGPGGGVYAISPSTVSRFKEHLFFENVAIPVELGFTGMENVSLAAGNQGDTFNVNGTGSAATLLLDGNSGSDRFNIDSPGFATINVQGDFPIFAPGDRLSVNEENLYAVATVPGLYPVGSGAMTIGASTSFNGIETSEMHPQIYGGPGDFDSNGVVEGLDLTHATLGFNTRFGDDLDGSDFLVWQRNFGVSLLPEETRGGQADPVEELQTIASIAAAGDDDEPRSDAFAFGSLAGQSTLQVADAPRKASRSRQREVMPMTPVVAVRKSIAWEVRDSAFALLGESDARSEGNGDSTSPWDDAFADFGLAVGAAV
jgi:CubicO group peptidase (beta-lactamase class C family)